MKRLDIYKILLSHFSLFLFTITPLINPIKSIKKQSKLVSNNNYY